MEMLLRQTTITELARIFARHKDNSQAPYLTDPQCVKIFLKTELILKLPQELQ